MNTILVPVDFSATAKNGAIYAAHLARELNSKKLVLYNAYSIPLATEMSWAVLQTEELQKASSEGLAEFSTMVQQYLPSTVVIETVSDFGFLQERIDDVVKETGADGIVMGITGGNKLEEVLIGSNTTHIVRHVHVPVFIIPADARWEPVRRIGYACDLDKVLSTTPAKDIVRLLDEFDASLHVVHTGDKPGKLSDDERDNESALHMLFSRYEANFKQVANDNFVEAIEEFIRAENISLMLIVPKKQNWFEGIFSRSHTTRLAFHTHVPLVCIRSL